MRIRFLLIALFALSPCSFGATEVDAARTTSTPQHVADELLEADRLFAKRAAIRSPSEAIAALLDDDAIVFILPQPPLTRGKTEIKELLSTAFSQESSTLSWAPVRVGISADGMHGFTYGFASQSIRGKTITNHKYVAYWVKRPQGWRVLAYKLVPRPDGIVMTAIRAPALPDQLVNVSGEADAIAKYTAELDRTERRFSDDAQIIGLGPAFRKYGSADAMNVGAAADFTYGNEAIAAGFGVDKSSPLRWAPIGTKVASSGDLGLTYGYLERNGPTPVGRLARIPWFTIWRRNDPTEPWLYVAE